MSTQPCPLGLHSVLRVTPLLHAGGSVLPMGVSVPLTHSCSLLLREASARVAADSGRTVSFPKTPGQDRSLLVLEYLLRCYTGKRPVPGEGKLPRWLKYLPKLVVRLSPAPPPTSSIEINWCG